MTKREIRTVQHPWARRVFAGLALGLCLGACVQEPTPTPISSRSAQPSDFIGFPGRDDYRPWIEHDFGPPPATPELARAFAALADGEVASAEAILDSTQAHASREASAVSQAHSLRGIVLMARSPSATLAASEEFAHAVAAASPESEDSLWAVHLLAGLCLQEGGFSAYEHVISSHASQLPVHSRAATTLRLCRWSMLVSRGEGGLMREAYPGLISELISGEAPQVTTVLQQRVQLEVQEGNWNEAVSVFEDFARRAPHDRLSAFLPIQAASLLGRHGSPEAARAAAARGFASIEALVESAQTPEEHGRAIAMRADAHLELGQIASAEVDFTSVIEEHRDLPFRWETMIRWSIMLWAQGRVDEARILARRTASEYPSPEVIAEAHSLIQGIAGGGTPPPLPGPLDAEVR